MPELPKSFSRRELTFAQVEGEEPLPVQLELRTVSKQLRLRLWDYLDTRMHVDRDRAGYVEGSTEDTLRKTFIYHLERPSDEFRASVGEISKWLKPRVLNGSYISVYGMLEFMVRNGWAGEVNRFNAMLEETRAPYRIVDESIIPIGSEQEATAIRQAFADAQHAGLDAAREHLKLAAGELNNGNFAASVRESIHAVESAARLLEPSAELSKALAKLEQSAKIHGALKKGFAAIYGYSSDEAGIRHPLVDEPVANVDETDAIFMLGACASFVSYLIGKARRAGIIK